MSTDDTARSEQSVIEERTTPAGRAKVTYSRNDALSDPGGIVSSVSAERATIFRYDSSPNTSETVLLSTDSTVLRARERAVGQVPNRVQNTVRGKCLQH